MAASGHSAQIDVAVMLGGEAVPQALPPLDGARIIAADGGLDLAERLGLHADLVVGDMDSVTPDALERARLAGAEVVSHPPDKDETDLELALAAAWGGLRGRTGASVVVLGGAGGRLDHLAANLAVLSGPRWRHVRITAWIGAARVDVVHTSRRMTGVPGMEVSILAWHGPAEGVTTTGLEWPLHRATLAPGSARGTSNRFTGDTATVSLVRGTVTVIAHDVPTSLWAEGSGA
jgi:thiamine pyrophosphokinase